MDENGPTVLTAERLGDELCDYLITHPRHDALRYRKVIATLLAAKDDLASEIGSKSTAHGR